MVENLQAINLSAGYKQKIILNNISCNINRGDFICLCGPNGSGKSTLISCLSNLQNSSLKIDKTSQILINNKNLHLLKPNETAQKIACLQQNEFSTWNFLVEDFVLQGRFCHTKNGFYSKEDRNIVSQSLQILGISHLAKENIHQISGGEFQKVRLARALCQQPQFLLLDEPAANLDFTYEPKLMEILKNLAENQNIGILLSIHNINIASQFAKKILLLSKNSKEFPQTLIEGTPQEILTQENLFKTFKKDFTLFNHPINNSIQIV